MPVGDREVFEDIDREIYSDHKLYMYFCSPSWKLHSHEAQFNYLWSGYAFSTVKPGQENKPKGYR